MKTNLLAIDTSSAECTVALQFAGAVFERKSETPRSAAQRLLPMIDEVLKEASCTFTDIDVIAAAVGPGSFTGIRIGIGAVQGLAMSTQTPTLGISSLAVAAMTARNESAIANVLVLNEARQEEVYFAAYTEETSLGVKLLGKEQLCRVSELDSSLAEEKKTQPWCAIGDGLAHLEQASSVLQLASVPVIAKGESSLVDSLLKLATLYYQQGKTVPAADLLPNYIREHLDYS